MSEKRKIGYAVCGSFCTFSKALEAIRALCRSFDVTPIFSEYAAATDTRFYAIREYVQTVEQICGHPAICSIHDAEPIGPKKLLDALVVAPCTGNTLGKLAAGVTDSSVSMAVKAHLRNDRPVILGVSTNDALSASAANIGALLNRRNIYFVPFRQDDPLKKPRSVVCDFTKIEDTLNNALRGKQIQPILL